MRNIFLSFMLCIFVFLSTCEVSRADGKCLEINRHINSLYRGISCFPLWNDEIRYKSYGLEEWKAEMDASAKEVSKLINIEMRRDEINPNVVFAFVNDVQDAVSQLPPSILGADDEAIDRRDSVLEDDTYMWIKTLADVDGVYRFIGVVAPLKSEIEIKNQIKRLFFLSVSGVSSLSDVKNLSTFSIRASEKNLDFDRTMIKMAYVEVDIDPCNKNKFINELITKMCSFFEKGAE